MVLSSLTLGPMARNITRYRRVVRTLGGSSGSRAAARTQETASRAAPARKDAAVAAVAHRCGARPRSKPDSYPDLGVGAQGDHPADARVVGFGELHARTDRAQVQSALARFTADALPAIEDKLSDLIVETWIVDPKCGQAAKTATAKVEITVRRPQETKSEIALLADAARAAKIQPHAMRINCDDYEKIAPSRPGR